MFYAEVIFIIMYQENDTEQNFLQDFKMFDMKTYTKVLLLVRVLILSRLEDFKGV